MGENDRHPVIHRTKDSFPLNKFSLIQFLPINKGNKSLELMQ
jgi:hypothetical protein